MCITFIGGAARWNAAMLNHSQVLAQLQAVSNALFLDHSEQYAIARASFARLCADSQLSEKIKNLTGSWAVPQWNGPLDAVVPVATSSSAYSVIGIDGSQIYPDKHQGTGCFLINIGLTHFSYGTAIPVHFENRPFVFTASEQEEGAPTDMVNCKRQELEFTAGYEYARTAQAKAGQPFLFLFDGSLIFWHLEAHDADIKERYLGKYIQSLQAFHAARIACAGYISLAKSKEVVSLIRAELCNFSMQGCVAQEAVDQVVDTAVAGFFLQPSERSTVFKSMARITMLYPAPIAPHFFYLHVGHEIGRVEIPGWIAQDTALVDQVAALILDQSIKGNGYPVALAEAHEQAVVKGPDREFFYQLIQKLAFEQKKRVMPSQKSIKKRGLGI